jgi:hypothetical protein
VTSRHPETIVGPKFEGAALQVPDLRLQLFNLRFNVADQVIDVGHGGSSVEGATAMRLANSSRKGRSGAQHTTFTARADC